MTGLSLPFEEIWPKIIASIATPCVINRTQKHEKEIKSNADELMIDRTIKKWESEGNKEF